MRTSQTAFVCLVLLGVTAPCVGQRFTWDLGRYDSAQFKRTTKSHSRLGAGSGDVAVAEASAKKDAEPVPAAAKKLGKNLIPNGSFEKVQRKNPRSWGKSVFVGKVQHKLDGGARHGKRSIKLFSDLGTDAAWYCNAKVKPRTWYRLSGFIKTKDVARGAGAQLNVHQLGRSALTERVLGNSPWKRVQVEFNSGAHAQVRINCLLGGWHRTRGHAWFDNLQLFEIARKSTQNAVDAALFRGPRRSTKLFGAELDRKRKSLIKPAADMRDVAAHLALDMSRANRGSKLKKQELRVRGFAPLWIEVSLKSANKDGSQDIVARIRPMKSRRKAPKPKKPKKGQPPPLPDLVAEGYVTITRFVEERRVKRFTSRLQLDVEIPAGFRPLPNARQAQVDIREEWTWFRDGKAEDSAFQRRVNEAIQDGARYLRGHGLKNQHRGHLALCVLTLLKAGQDARDPYMASLINRLRRTKMVKTYDCAVGLMALEALYAPATERDLLLAGRIHAPMQRNPTPEDLDTMRRWSKTLMGNIDTRIDKGYVQRWNYTPGKRFDNSNTQYAMLGLYCAHLCGVEIPATVWFGCANHWLKTQSRPVGKATSLDLTSYTEDKKNKQKGKRRTVTRGASVRPRGWGYTSPRGLTGSMTTAGITGLVICEAALRQHKKGDKKLFSEMREAIRAGYAWLDKNFAVDHNPGRATHWHYYYLYGLERACEINGTKKLNGRLWYTEGAELLLDQRRKDGSWKSIVDTCFAILFLKKAAPPVITGGR